MITESKTPESDHAATVAYPYSHQSFVYLDFARTLETQRDEARAEVERLRKQAAQLEDEIQGLKHLWVPSPPQPVPSSTTPEIFEAHGLEWYRHTPGDKMPCNGSEWVQAFLRDGEIACLKDEVEASFLEWGKTPDCKECEIIGWRPADAPAKLPRNK